MEKNAKSQLLESGRRWQRRQPAKPYENQKAKSIFGGHLHYCFLIPNMYSHLFPFVRLLLLLKLFIPLFFRLSIFLSFSSISCLLFSAYILFLYPRMATTGSVRPLQDFPFYFRRTIEVSQLLHAPRCHCSSYYSRLDVFVCIFICINLYTAIEWVH